MVTIEIPNDHGLSQSQATPQLTINHEIAAELDSSNAFEGPEKLLEVWFAPSPAALSSSVKENGLKSVPSDSWVGMLDMVNCKILSVIHSEIVDAYLLSESSMFVFPHKIILKTCGTTTLLLGLQRMLHIAAAEAGFPFHNATSLSDIRSAATPYRIFYSRKNFLFPDKQQGPHRSWNQEVKFLDDMFEGGSAYMVGKMNGDHWYLYITSPNSNMASTPPRTPDRKTNGNLNLPSKIPTGLIPSSVSGNAEINDETLEILMTDLDPENAKQFYLSHAAVATQDKIPYGAGQTHNSSNEDRAASLSGSPLCSSATEDMFDVDDLAQVSSGMLTPQSDHMDLEDMPTEGHAMGTAVSVSCGLSDIYPTSVYPDARIDAYMFAPCGFSANAVIPAPAVTHSAADGTETDVHSGAIHYFTVHVTPEPNCSFASFETNVPGGQKGRQTADIVKHVVDIFRPGRFSVTLFETKGTVKDQYFLADDGSRQTSSAEEKRRLERIPGYRRIDRIVHDFEDYDLVFRYYEREGWVGNGEARLGEL